MTLRELVAEHPEWLDHTLVVYTGHGYSYIGASGLVYETDEMEDKDGRDCEATGIKLLVFN
jgi:hypothetical protein